MARDQGAYSTRRSFCRTLAGILIAPSIAIAQDSKAVRRIGWLWNASPQSPDEIAKAYPTHLRALGWIEGQNLVIERRYSGGRPELLKAPAEELAGLKLDLIAAEGTIATLAVKNATNSIPIVFARSGDPVRAGLVASLARPGGNVTGTTTISTDLDQKRLQLLRELLPETRRVGELVVPANPIELAARSDYQRVYRALGMQPIFVEVATASELEAAVDELARRGAQALHVSAEPLLRTNLSEIVIVAQRHLLPAMVEDTSGLEAGRLISYGPDQAELDRQAGTYHRQDSTRRKTCRTSGATTPKVRTRHQSQGGEGPWGQSSAVVASTRRRGDSVVDQERPLLGRELPYQRDGLRMVLPTNSRHLTRRFHRLER